MAKEKNMLHLAQNPNIDIKEKVSSISLIRPNSMSVASNIIKEGQTKSQFDDIRLEDIPDVERYLTLGDRAIAEVLEIKFLEMNSIDVTTDRFNQLGVKNKSEYQQFVEDMANCLLSLGWNPRLGVYLIDEEGEAIDGRTKILGSRSNLEYVPTVVYKWMEGVTETDKWKLISAINPQSNHFSAPIGIKYFTEIGTAFIHDGTLKTKSDIEFWVDFESGAAYRWDRTSANGKGMITKIKNQLTKALNKLEETKKLFGENETIYVGYPKRGEEYYNTWVFENYPKWGEQSRYWIRCIDQTQEYAERFFVRNVLPFLNGDSDEIPRLITMSKKTLVTEAEENKRLFFKKLNSLIDLYYDSVEYQTGISVSRIRPYNVLGSIPQYIGDNHGVDKDGYITGRTTLVKIDEKLLYQLKVVL